MNWLELLCLALFEGLGASSYESGNRAGSV